MRDIKIEVMFYAYNQSMAKVIKKHYTTVDRLCESNLLFKQDLEIVCKRQFTGLKDKNGVEIYEGDIVTCDYTGYSDFCSLSGYHEVKYISERGFSPMQEPVDYDEQYAENDNWLVVGNIYENPELIE